MQVLQELLSTHVSVGRVEWIGVATQKRGAVLSVEAVDLVQGSGIAGERHFRAKNRSKRQVTLIQYEHLQVVASLLGRPGGFWLPALLRRNLVVSGINLAALRYQTFQLGTAVLTGTGSCPPCSRMEENLGPGGYAAMLGHGGITAIVAGSGQVRVGDAVSVVPDSPVQI